jgi:hypothetical protein
LFWFGHGYEEITILISEKILDVHRSTVKAPKRPARRIRALKYVIITPTYQGEVPLLDSAAAGFQGAEQSNLR